MTEFDTLPQVIDANYAVWTPDSEITLTNVPWDNNYRDIVRFPSANTLAAHQAALNTYIESQGTTNTKILDSRYARADQPVRLSIGMTAAYGYNYVRVRNRAQNPVNNAEMYYYYFVTGIIYVNPGVTLFNVQLDIWQTFGPLVNWGNSYIEQGHIGIANSKAFDNYGRDYLTLPEGLDTGSDHRVVYDRKFGDAGFGPGTDSVMVLSNIDLTQDPGDINNPGIKTSQGSKVIGAPSGADVYFFNSDNFQKFIKAYQSKPWILQGIMSITSVPNPQTLGYTLVTKTANLDSSLTFQVIDPRERGRGKYVNVAPNWRTATGPNSVAGAIPDRYKSLKKFFTFPYMSIELTSFTGAPVVLKPEQWQDANGACAIKTNFVYPGVRQVIYPRRYNGSPTGNQETATYSGVGSTHTEYFIDSGDYLEASISLGNFPSYAIVNNGGILAIANQAHSLAQQYKTNDWSQQKALAGNQTSYDQSSAYIQNSQTQAALGRNANIQTAQVANSQEVARGIVGIGSGAIGGAISGGGAGAAAGTALGAATAAANIGLNISQRNQNLAISNNTGVAQTSANTDTSNYIKDTNKSLADWAAKGDYAQQVASINAKVQDTAMTPPFTSGQAGGETFNYVFGNLVAYARFKMLPPGELAAIGEYWLRYGYAVRRFSKIPQNLHVMSKFTYWKLTETYISSARIPEGYKQAIRGILEKGVTVWASPADIGNIDIATNTPLSGITL